MRNLRTPRSATVAALGAALCLASGCAAEGATVSPEELGSALLPEFEDTEQLNEHEVGLYGELESVQYAEELRASADLDKPECMDAAAQWRELEEVRSAPTALASYAREGEAITHTLVAVDDATAEEALEMRPSEECRIYQAMDEEGSTTTYEVSDLDVAEVGQGSYASVVETEVEGGPVRMYSMLYHGAEHLGMTTVLGTDAREETLLAFAQAAEEHEAEILG